MKAVIFLTVYNRPHYLEAVLESWSKVRRFFDTPVYVIIEPSPVQRKVYEMLALAGHTNMRIHLNERVEGVLHNPWLGFEKMFNEGYDFVIRAEDDLLVSSDILEFFSWASRQYNDNTAAVCTFSTEQGSPERVRYDTDFSPWVWGTWSQQWYRFIRDTWDHDYSTFNGEPGHQSGWDWNLNTREMPARGMNVIKPVLSRSQNIGVEGVHGTRSNFLQTPYFEPEIEPGSFRFE